MKRIIPILTVAAVLVAITAAAALPALAQQPPGPTTLTATGVLVGPVEDNDPDPTPEFRLTDEATGTTYNLISGFVDLSAFAGHRVTVEGVRVPGIDPLAFNVTNVQPAPVSGGTTTAPGRAQLPATGGTSLSLLPAVALVLGGGILGAAVLRRGR